MSLTTLYVCALFKEISSEGKAGKKAGKVVRAASPLQPLRVFRSAAAQLLAPCGPPADRPSRGLHPRAPLRGYLHPSCAACPGCAKPLYALLHAAPAGCRGALRARQSPRARRAAGGGMRDRGGDAKMPFVLPIRENAVCFAYPSYLLQQEASFATLQQDLQQRDPMFYQKLANARRQRQITHMSMTLDTPPGEV